MGSQGKNTEVVCHSLLQWTTFCQTSPPWPTRLGWPHRAWLSFIELDQALVLMWVDWQVFRDYSFIVLPSDALLQHLLSYVGFSYLGLGISLQGCSSKAQLLLLTLDEGLSPHHPSSWPWSWNSSCRPSCTRAATAPWMWGCSFPAASPGLGRGVAPLCRSCAVAGWHSWLPPLTSDVG